LETGSAVVAYSREEDAMSPRKPTIDDLDDVDDEDGVLEEEITQETDLDLTVHPAEDLLALDDEQEEKK
jgi:hypothetical protein